MSLIKSGIYKITNIFNGRIYIGSAVNLVVRIRHHKARLRAKDHRNIKLQRSFDKYGMDAFTFEVVEYVEDVTKLIEREQHWIDSTNCASKGFNIAALAGSTLGVVGSTGQSNTGIKFTSWRFKSQGFSWSLI